MATQYELIQKWEKEADDAEEEWERRRYGEVDVYYLMEIAGVFRACANDLKAMTY